MFRRKSSKKRSETAGSSSRASSSEDFVEDGESSDDKPQLNSPQQPKESEAGSFIPSEIIRHQLFTPRWDYEKPSCPLYVTGYQRAVHGAAGARGGAEV